MSPSLKRTNIFKSTNVNEQKPAAPTAAPAAPAAPAPPAAPAALFLVLLADTMSSAAPDYSYVKLPKAAAHGEHV